MKNFEKSKLRNTQAFARFQPEDYLQEYYYEMGHENRELMKFFAAVYGNMPEDFVMAEIGGGPTIYQLISAAPKAKQIFFYDFLDTNLGQIRKWIDKKDDSFDWSQFFQYALEEESAAVLPKDINNREALLRKKLIISGHCDIYSLPVIEAERKFDLVSTNFVVDSATDDIQSWKHTLSNITSLIKNDGYLVMTSLLGADHWISGAADFPAVPLTKRIIVNFLEKQKFQILHDVEIVSDEQLDTNTTDHGYSGMYFVLAQLL